MILNACRLFFLLGRAVVSNCICVSHCLCAASSGTIPARMWAPAPIPDHVLFFFWRTGKFDINVWVDEWMDGWILVDRIVWDLRNADVVFWAWFFHRGWSVNRSEYGGRRLLLRTNRGRTVKVVNLYNTCPHLLEGERERGEALQWKSIVWEMVAVWRSPVVHRSLYTTFRQHRSTVQSAATASNDGGSTAIFNQLKFTDFKVLGGRRGAERGGKRERQEGEG